MLNILDNTQYNKRSGIYGILNTVTGKIYVGSAIKLHRRITDHIYFLNLEKHHSILLQRAWLKYGKDAFEFLVLEYVYDKNKLIEREQYWLDLTSCYKPSLGYNTSAVAGSVLGIKHSPEARAKRSKALTGIIRSTETRAKMSAARKGVSVHSKESRIKISNAGKNRQVSLSTRQKLSEAGKNRKHSPETIEKLKLASKSKKNLHHIGVKRSEVTLAKMRAAWVIRKENKLNDGWSTTWE